MTRHYQGKQRTQARTHVDPTLLVACFPDGERAFIPVAGKSDQELADDIRYCNERGAVSYHTEPMSDAVERARSAEFERMADAVKGDA